MFTIVDFFLLVVTVVSHLPWSLITEIGSRAVFELFLEAFSKYAVEGLEHIARAKVNWLGSTAAESAIEAVAKDASDATEA